MRVVVTGGAGFIGAHTCRALAAAGHHVTAYDDLSTGTPANLTGTDIELIEGTILDRQAVARAVEGADAVVHLAARSSIPRSFDEPDRTCQVNVEGTRIVAEAAADRHLIVASSSSVYGGNAAMPKHEDLEPRPLNPYAASKLHAEGLVGANALVFRFFNVFGPRQPPRHRYAAVVPAFVQAALHDRPLPVHGDGLQTRDFTYVGNVASVLVDAVARRVVHDGPVNLAFGTRVAVLELADAIGALLRRQLQLEFLPSRCGDMRDTQADTTRFDRLFPDIEPIELKDGLRETLAWHQS
jgi:UDP-glucose 4-epimerase